jgi:transcriptional regulator with XRE-family HTH domain
VRYLEMIEAGTKTPTIRVLRRLAEVLRVRVAALVSDEPSEDRGVPAGRRLTEVERALYDYGSLSPTGPDGGPPDPPDLAELTRRMDAARSAWFLSPNKYSETLDVLPGLIVDAEHAVRAYGRSLEAHQRAAEVYRLARFAFTHGGGRTSAGSSLTGGCATQRRPGNRC